MSSVFSNAAWNPANANGCVVSDATQGNCTAGVVPERRLAELELSAPQPNPTVERARLHYTLPFASFVRLSVTDVAGRQVAMLDRKVEGPGAHEATWNALDATGRGAPPGIYFARLEPAGQTVSRRIVLAR